MKILRLIPIILVTFVGSQKLWAKPQDTPIKVTVDGRGDAYFHHPETKEMLHLIYPGQDEILKASPKSLAERLKQGSLEAAQSLGKVGRATVNNPIIKPAVDTFVNFPMHAIPFYSAMFSIAVVQVHLGQGHDPMAIARFWESMADLPGHVGFAAFIYTNHQFSSIMNAMFNDNTFKNYMASYRKIKATTDPKLKRRLMTQLRSRQRVVQKYWEPLRSQVARPTLFVSQYMGMALGSLASGIVTDFLTDPNVRVCSGKIFKMSETPECELAYEKWTSHDHWWNFAPHATSVVAAAFASLSTHKIVSVGARAAFGLSIAGLSRIVPKVGLIALRFNQVGWAVSMGYMFVNAANFLVWSHFLEYPARRFHFQTFVAKNTTGPALKDFEVVMDYLKNSGWSEKSITDANKAVYDMNKRKDKSPVLTATTFQKPLNEITDHYKQQIIRYRDQNIMYKTESTFAMWQDYLMNYETIRDFSDLFYKNYINQIFLSYKSPNNLELFLNKDYPLYGIARTPLFSSEEFSVSTQQEKENFKIIDRIIENNSKDLAQYLIHEFSQKKTVKMAAELLLGQMTLITLNSSPISLRFTQDVINQIYLCIELLSNSSTDSMGKGIVEFYRIFSIITNSDPYRPMTVHSREITDQLTPLFDDIHTLWSNNQKDLPYPRSAEEALMISVEDIIATNMILDIYGEANPQTHQAIEELKGNHVKNYSSIPTRSIGEALLVSMVCGPDPEEGESVVYSPKGWRAQFLPPKIVKGNTSRLCRQNPLEVRNRSYNPFEEVSENLHHWDFEYNGKQYKGLGSLIVDNLKESVRGEKTNIYSALDSGWWKEHVWDEDDKARIGFQKKYEEEIRKTLIPALVNSSYSARGKIANGLVNSMADELGQWAKVVNGLYSKVVQSNHRSEGEAQKMTSLLESSQKDLKNLLLSLEDFAQKGELTNEFYTLAQRTLIALHSTVDESENISYTNFYPLFTQLLYEIPGSENLSEQTNKDLDQMYGDLDLFLEGQVESHDLRFDKLKEKYEQYNLLLIKAYTENKNLQAVTKIEKRIEESSKLIKLKKILPNLSEAETELYLMASGNIVSLINEAYLKYQLVYNFYSQIPNLNGEKISIDNNRRHGARHN